MSPYESDESVFLDKLVDDNSYSVRMDLETELDRKFKQGSQTKGWTENTTAKNLRIAKRLIGQIPGLINRRGHGVVSSRLEAVIEVGCEELSRTDISYNYFHQIRSVLDMLVEECSSSKGQANAAKQMLRSVLYVYVPSGGAGSDRRFKPKEPRIKKVKRWYLNRHLRYLAKQSITTRYADDLANMIVATIYTGLRPSEWAFTTLFKEQADTGWHIYLAVLNGKATHGRANGPTRVLDVSSFPDEALETIRYVSWRALNLREEMPAPGQNVSALDAWLKGISDYLRRSREKCFNGKAPAYTLYTLRHQAIANWKTCMSPAEVAVLAGHCSVDTAHRYYARKGSAWKDWIPEMPKPEFYDLERVWDYEHKKEAAPALRLPFQDDQDGDSDASAAFTPF